MLDKCTRLEDPVMPELPTVSNLFTYHANVGYFEDYDPSSIKTTNHFRAWMKQEREQQKESARKPPPELLATNAAKKRRTIDRQSSDTSSRKPPPELLAGIDPSDTFPVYFNTKQKNRLNTEPND